MTVVCQHHNFNRCSPSISCAYRQSTTGTFRLKQDVRSTCTKPVKITLLSKFVSFVIVVCIKHLVSNCTDSWSMTPFLIMATGCWSGKGKHKHKIFSQLNLNIQHSKKWNGVKCFYYCFNGFVVASLRLANDRIWLKCC